MSSFAKHVLFWIATVALIMIITLVFSLIVASLIDIPEEKDQCNVEDTLELVQGELCFPEEQRGNNP